MSDISSFAEWEAQQRDQLAEGEEVLTERQQLLLDMASEDRVWADMDSSNDFGSYASDEDDAEVEGGGVALPAHAEIIDIPGSTSVLSQVVLQTLGEVSSAGRLRERRADFVFCSVRLQTKFEDRGRVQEVFRFRRAKAMHTITTGKQKRMAWKIPLTDSK